MKEEVKEEAKELPKLAAAVGGNLMIWMWNVNGIRAVLRDGSFKKFVDLGKYLTRIPI